MHNLRMRLFLVAVLAAFLAACASWVPVVPEWEPGRPHRAERFRIWSGDSVLVMHAVRFGRDSIEGVPIEARPACVECRVSIAVAEVDSVQVRRDRLSLWAWAAVSLGAVGLIAFWFLILPRT